MEIYNYSESTGRVFTETGKTKSATKTTELADIPDSSITYTAADEPLSKSIFEYDSLSNLSQQFDFSWNSEKLIWKNSFTTSYSMDKDKQLLLSEQGVAFTQEQGNTTIPFYKINYSYT